MARLALAAGLSVHLGPRLHRNLQTGLQSVRPATSLFSCSFQHPRQSAALQPDPFHALGACWAGAHMKSVCARPQDISIQHSAYINASAHPPKDIRGMLAYQKSPQLLRRSLSKQLVRLGRVRTFDHSLARPSPVDAKAWSSSDAFTAHTGAAPKLRS